MIGGARALTEYMKNSIKYGGMSSKKPQKILLVEDEESLILLYSTLLERDYDVFVEKNKESAQKRLRENDIDLVLLDIIIPPGPEEIIDYSKRAGFELLEEMGGEGRLNGVKVIVLTNLENQKDRRQAEKLGADDYIVKSEVIPRKVLEKIKNILS